ncbi:MAG TPA: hypothetical protein VLS90_06130, partial [Thermodesulfobacteriota bacterium]|nr:hypothetical protein [Thermodesulfobacteriota bacterium]
MSTKLFRKAQTLLSQEKKVLPFPPPPADVSGVLSVALAYPNRYYTAMSNLGFQAVYWLMNREPETVCERVFLPDPEDIPEHIRAGTPLFSLESRRAVRSFDLLAFSLSYENDYPNVLTMLELAGIPVLKKDRGERGPLVMAGGASVLMNPEPLADFIDFFAVGEAEEMVGEILRSLHRGRDAGFGRDALLEELARIEGVYVPSLYDISYKADGTVETFTPRGGAPPRVKRIWVKDVNRSVTLSPIVTPNTELSGMLLLELSRGCRRGCRFCAGCYAYFPHRLRRETLVAEALESAGDVERVGLVGAAISDYPELVPLGREILARNKGVSFSS